MAVAIVLDFPGGTLDQYHQVVEKMDLGGRMPAGGLHHSAGTTDDGLRVVDVWESMEHFQPFAEAKIKPLSAEAGLPEPRMRVVEVHNYEQADGGEARLVQVLDIDMDAATYDSVHAEIGQPLPEGIVWHVAGPLDGAWCIIDSWTSREARDKFLAEQVQQAMQKRNVPGPPRVEDLEVQATLASGATATA
jgi:hypothetical protein